MAIKPEDRPKLIGLIVALCGVLVYVLFALVPKLMGGGASGGHTDPPPAPLTAASATVPGGGQSASGEASAALPDEESGSVPAAPPRDSFTPPPASTHPPEPQLAPAVKPAVPLAVQPAGLAAPGAPGTIIAPAAPIPPPLPAIELKGVILGDPAVAVIGVNGEVVLRQAGETIVGNLRLVQISDVGITVEDGKKRVPVTVGHIMAGSGVQPQAFATQAARPNP